MSRIFDLKSRADIIRIGEQFGWATKIVRLKLKGRGDDDDSPVQVEARYG